MLQKLPFVGYTYLRNTSTSAAKYDLPIDHDPLTGEALGVLIEEQRTNTVLRSAEFTHASWVKLTATATAAFVLGPDGLMSGTRILDTGSGTSHFGISQDLGTWTSGETRTISFFLKYANNVRWVRVFNDVMASTYFDIQNGVVGNVGAGCTAKMKALANGWYRCDVTGPVTGTDASATLQCYASNANGGLGWIRIGTDDFYVWAAQSELGAFPTSYIQTGSAQVTRAADQVSLATSAFNYSASAGTVLALGEINGNGAGNTGWWALDAGAVQNGHALRVAVGSNILAVSRGATTNQTVTGFAGPVVAGTFYKSAVAYSNENDRAISTDGAAVVSGTTAVGTINAATTLRLGFQQVTTTGGYLNGHIKRRTDWNSRKPNAELQVLSA